MSFDPSRAIFNQVDTNRDGNIDQGEFSQFLSGAGGGSSGAGFGSSSSYESSQYASGGQGGASGFESSSFGSGGQGGASGYESSSFSSGGYGGGDAAFAGGAGGFGGSSSYESSASFGAGGAGAGGFGESSSYESSASYGAGAGGAVGFAAGGSNAQGFDSSSFNSQTTVQTYATDAQGLFKDPNPQIIRRAAVGGVQTYTQNIRVRFLQPPPIPPPGVCR